MRRVETILLLLSLPVYFRLFWHYLFCLWLLSPGLLWDDTNIRFNKAKRKEKWTRWQRHFLLLLQRLDTSLSNGVLKAIFSEIQSQDMSSSSFPSKTKPLFGGPASQPIRGLIFGGTKLELMFWLGSQKKLPLAL